MNLKHEDLGSTLTPVVKDCINLLENFYDEHSELKESQSHGFSHALVVFRHAVKAIQCLTEEDMTNILTHEKASTRQIFNEIQIAALLHDVDDRKYFPNSNINKRSTRSTRDDDSEKSRLDGYINAKEILCTIEQSKNNLNSILGNINIDRIIYMIDLVSCSKNGNSVPVEIEMKNRFYLLIPRWADRLEAVGVRGVIRCYQYTVERGNKLFSSKSPRPQSEEELWQVATPSRFERYWNSDKKGHHASISTTDDDGDMISHYYDKLLHVAQPPSHIVKNKYLEDAAKDGCRELIKVCLNFGLTGRVDEDYMRQLSSM